MFLFSFKRGYLKCNSFKISVKCRWCQKCKHKNPPKNGVTPKLPSEVAQCL